MTFAGKAAESVAKYVPERPDWAFLAEVPAMTEIVDNQLQFRRRVVDEQADFIRTLMKAIRPALSRLEPAAPAAKAPATKAPAATKTARTSRPRAAKATVATASPVHRVRVQAA